MNDALSGDLPFAEVIPMRPVETPTSPVSTPTSSQPALSYVRIAISIFST